MSGYLSATVGGGVLAAGLVDILHNMFEAARGLIVLAVILMGMVFVIMTWSRTRSLMPTIGALIVGALVVWGVSSFEWFANRAGEDIEGFDEDAGEPDTGISRPGED